ncbi:coenzyme F420-0:L-glutamate ligase [Gulosibacter molinativorax]|uniref:F420-0--gamma-glutamyl ligase n=1 Tax=Gulosibacter molinativorax TaxID=256821 RepID=A0ABT7C4N1_9MICO|nr:coenzyme F420-0:L-glutamate ligase [Gulosibacter molinativorax]MDJ1370159.1 F420-0--gamma-glutamyl ligase [Gulosibacter molinativorax]QUY61570.1 F420-0:Gamma-glutamyl ligase-related protein [Gulosibacter molinativorax]
MQPNDGKTLESTVDGKTYQRIPIKTHVVMADDDLRKVVRQYAEPVVQDGDVLFVTEKIVAITQGRSMLLEEIEPRPLANFLAKYVTKTPHGIGLGMPETMEMALQECGTPRILFAAAAAAVTKPMGRKGDFYRIAGEKARAIDGPTDGTIPPYNKSVVLGPDKPMLVARDLKILLGNKVDVLIVDINDIGGNILGTTLDEGQNDHWVRVLKDNPLGQGHQSTPMGILRQV